MSAPSNLAMIDANYRLQQEVELLRAERDALRQRVADFERLVAEPRVEQVSLLALRDVADQLARHERGEVVVDEAQAEAWRQEILKALPDVLDEALMANLHRRLNKGVAGALGLLEMRKDPKTRQSYLPSWHDIPEQVAALKAKMADLLKPVGPLDLRGSLDNVRALRELLAIPVAERTTGERADLEALYAGLTEAVGMVLTEIPRLRAALAARAVIEQSERSS